MKKFNLILFALIIFATTMTAQKELSFLQTSETDNITGDFQLGYESALTGDAVYGELGIGSDKRISIRGYYSLNDGILEGLANHDFTIAVDYTHYLLKQYGPVLPVNIYANAQYQFSKWSSESVIVDAQDMHGLIASLYVSHAIGFNDVALTPFLGAVFMQELSQDKDNDLVIGFGASLLYQNYTVTLRNLSQTLKNKTEISIGYRF